MKTIFLTGGTGFIGKSILNSYLKDKYEILAPSHKELDLMDFRAVENYVFKYCPNIIIHMASMQDGPSIVYTNTMMYQNLARFAYTCDKFINISSGAVYDCSRDLDNVKEQSLGLYVPKDHYGYSKYLNAIQSAYSRNIVELFLFGIIGKYERLDRFVTRNIHQILWELPQIVYRDRLMSYIDIDDFITILDMFISYDKVDTWQRYNIPGNAPISLLELAGIINTITGRSLKIVSIKEGRTNSYSGSNVQLHSIFPNIRYTPIEETIEKIYIYWKERL